MILFEVDAFCKLLKFKCILNPGETIEYELSPVESLCYVEGNVWCTGKNLFQETTQLGGMIRDINLILTNTDPSLFELEFLYKLQ